MTETGALSRRNLLLGAAPVAVAGGAVVSGIVPAVARGVEAPRAELVDTGSETLAVRRITLYAERVGDGFGYGLARGGATIPGPTITMDEGEQLEVRLVNTTHRTLSLHAHGVDYDVDSDGTRMNDGCLEPGESRVFRWRAHRTGRRADGSIRIGTAGYWHYHDHCMRTPHGTEGILSGLYGALIVRRRGDLLPARGRTFVVVMLDLSINGRVAPNTPTFVADLGQRVEFVVIGHGNTHHTFHLHAHRWADNRTGNVSAPDPQMRVIDNRTVGPADSFGFQVIAGEGVGPGMWMYHCHVQGHADAGMVGVFLVRNADGTVPADAREALGRFQATWAAGHPSHSLTH